MANDSGTAAPSNDQEDGAHEPMEGITAPPASPADANPSTTSKTTAEETEGLGVKGSIALKRREITSTASDAVPPGQVQAASTEVVHPEQAATISNETEPDSAEKTKTDPAAGETSKPSTKFPESAMNEKADDDKPSPDPESKDSNAPNISDNPETAKPENAKNEEKRSATKGAHSKSSQDPDEDTTIADSKPSEEAGTKHDRSDVNEEDKEAEGRSSTKDHLSKSKTAEKSEDSVLPSPKQNEASDVAPGEKVHELDNGEGSSTEAKRDNSGKQKSESSAGKPNVSTSISQDAKEDTLKDKGESATAEAKGSSENTSKDVGDGSPSVKPTVEKTEPSKENPITEQTATPMEVDSGDQQAESNEGKMKEGTDSAHIKKSGGKGPVSLPTVGKKGDEISGDVVMTESIVSKTDTGLDQTSQAEDENAASSTKAKKNVRKGASSRLLRTRSTSRGGAPDSSIDSGGKHDPAPPEPGRAPQQKSSDTASQASKGKEVIPEDDGPRPVMEAKGLAMRVANAVFVTEDQLDEPKIARLKDKKVLPFEHLTFKELRTYNRDQLRAYCFAYGMERRKKTEMEADMARYLSYWNRGKPGFALHEYIPTSGRIIDRDEFFGNRSSQANQSAASLGGISFSGADGSKRYGSRIQSASGAYGDKGSGAGAHASGSANPQTSPSTPSGGNANRNLRAGGTPTSLPRGFGTSFKQRVHARQASAKFKAAYNGAGDTIVNVVENAAAYFEGKDSPEVIADQTKSFERYQFNVDLLTEIFDGPIQEDVEVPKVGASRANGNLEGAKGQNEKVSNATTTSGAQGKTDVMFDIAKRLLSNKRSAHQAELDSFETNLKRAEEKAKHTERRNMRLFQKLERAETLEQVEGIKKEFEKEFGTSVDVTSRPVIRRKIDKTLPPLVIPDDQSRILRFTFL